MNGEPDFYSILGVKREATDVEIRQAFRALAKKYHPDSQQASGVASDLDFRRFTEAYETLKDPERRAAYDEELSQGRQLTAFGERLRPNAFVAGVAAGVVVAALMVGGVFYFGGTKDGQKSQDSLRIAATKSDRHAHETLTQAEGSVEQVAAERTDNAASATKPQAASSEAAQPVSPSPVIAPAPSAPAETVIRRTAAIEKPAAEKPLAPSTTGIESASEPSVEPRAVAAVPDRPVPLAADPRSNAAARKVPSSVGGVLDVPTGLPAREVVRQFEPGNGQRESFSDCAHCPEMVVIPAGQAVVGARPESAGYRPEEAPAHRVVIKKPLAISKRVISAGNWRACVDAGVCRLTLSSLLAVGPTVPATRLTWFDAKGYVDWLSQTTGRRYRLLSEAEWEYALRATSDRNRLGRSYQANRLPFDPMPELGGGGPLGRMRYARASVTSANAWGLHTGTVFEWVEDCWHANYDRAPADGAAWLSASGGDCAYRVVRGAIRGDAARFSARAREFADIGAPMLGFRVARDILPPARTALGEP
ncbi:SUMF1/EgtB/PvdO family nonheme iron enzyme [Rhodomicrobium sp. Az07]|uniref:SUMF1/EgtB/PvdO family nonheme iron enzyme n=1 Tax=Rhodomicrobium sp. Az07 TaxID=2839034 RepID=UPI001BEB7D16|nr:SUMF1/EgtB/PvdO family nonheme iron enzyme [Rhodomicrobium sp. Az07]MBT3071275.1 SUMF1/EgtB/PvdO family nonheme iron enzyme [Rhodomicrobium sp. Az07]